MSVDCLLLTGVSGTGYDLTAPPPIYTFRRRTTGTYRIATHLRDHGYDTEVIDFMFAWTLDELKEIARSRLDENSKMVGIGSIFDSNSPTLATFLTWCKETWPQLLILAGSQDLWHIASLPADYHITGYGEKGVIAALKGNVEYQEKISVHGVTNRHVNCHAIEEYQAYPEPTLHVSYEDRDFIEPNESLVMETSRGCKFQCKYCNFPVLGVKGDYTRDADNFREDLIRNYDKWGVTNYVLADETFNDAPSKITKFANVVQSLDFETNFGGFVRLDLIASRDGEMEELARMRHNSHMYGIESTNRPSTKAIGKGMDPQKLLDKALEIKEYFMKNNDFYRGEMSFICGLPYETRETLQKTLDWIDNYWKGESHMWYALAIFGETSEARANLLAGQMEDYGYEHLQGNQLDELQSHVNLERFQYIFDDPNIADFMKEKIRRELPDFTTPAYRHHFKTWRNADLDSWTSWAWVQENAYAHDRYWDCSPGVFYSDEWHAVGYSRKDVLQSFRQLGSIVYPDIALRIASIEKYKQSKLNYVAD